MNLSRICTLVDLKYYLACALQLEHATIPPYLTAMYSLIPGTNTEVARILRVVAVEEMLHLALVANLLNAVGGEPNLLSKDFIPDYPAYLPDGESEFQVSIEAFSPRALDTFLRIEQPSRKHSLVEGEAAKDRPYYTNLRALLKVDPNVPRLAFDTIGDFYEAIREGFKYLYLTMGPALFKGDPARQLTPEYYYSGGGKLLPVVDLRSAFDAIQLISDQGEGYEGHIFGHEGELAHYYRFKQIQYGKYYMKEHCQQGHNDDHPPTGPELDVDFNSVYPIKPNAKLRDYPEGSELRAAAVDFAMSYNEFLGLINKAFNGQPALLMESVPQMFRLKEKAQALVRNKIPGMENLHAAPIFKLPK
ncbi:MAG: hypothetical protein JWP89_5440 [Schlesneria sp.]|nr:hypothetical protein [Schlesneria sp.]